MCELDAIVNDIALRLWEAEHRVEPILPFADQIGANGIAEAYRIQRANITRGLEAGRVLRGRKIGLTSRAVQKQLGVDEPDYGTLFADMEIKTGGTLDHSALIAPKIEAEIALFIGQDVTEAGMDEAALGAHVSAAASSLEIVDSRLKDWQIGILDTIADNGASACFVLGEMRVPLSEIDLGQCRMELLRNGTVVSEGTGAETLGHPLKALAWLADILIKHGQPLLAGDIVLTGALGPVVPIAVGDHFEAVFDGLSPVALRIT